MKLLQRFLILIPLLILPACDDTDFASTWQDPSARPLQLRSEHVAALLLSDNEAVRRSFEQNLANELNERGIEATPGYELLTEADVTDKAKVLADLKTTSADHAVVMRVVDREMEVNYQPGSAWYPGIYYDPFLYYHGAFVGPWWPDRSWPPFYDAGYYRIDTIVSVETLIYSVPDSRLLWAGLSKTMNPSEVDEFVEELVSGAVKEMKKTGFFPS